MENGLLRDFFRKREVMARNVVSAPAKATKGTPNKFTDKGGISLPDIIESKPKPAKVIEYFRKRAEELENAPKT